MTTTQYVEYRIIQSLLGRGPGKPSKVFWASHLIAVISAVALAVILLFLVQELLWVALVAAVAISLALN